MKIPWFFNKEDRAVVAKTELGKDKPRQSKAERKAIKRLEQQKRGKKDDLTSI